MSFKSKLSSLFVMMFAFAAFSVAVSAQDAAKEGDKANKTEHHGGRHGGFGKGMRGGKGGGYMRGLRGIELTDAQKEQIRSIHEANKPDQATMEQMRSLMEARRAGTITAEQKETMKTLRQQARAKHEQVEAQILAVLTQEQRQQIEAKRQEMQQRRQERRKERRESDKVKPTDG